MKKQVRRTSWRCLAILLGCLAAITASAEDERVEAKIGIKLKSGKEVTRAKARNLVKAGDLIRIYVHPQEDVYVYVVHSDGRIATLLNMTMQKVQSTMLTLPSMSSFYKVDGDSSMEKITIVCSPEELPLLSDMIDNNRPNDRWTAIEKELLSGSKIVLAQKDDDERGFGIAGNVRGTQNFRERDPFITKLPVYSGAGLLVRKYEFMVQD